ncbi:MAG: peptidylprolyl isomerase [Chloroflexota bacterium]|nr:peptidylprolyl isomerase [Chloroflexota bacterium]
MQITKNKVVTFEFKVTDEAGTVLDNSEEVGAYPYVHGIGHLIPGLETEMEGKFLGDSFSISIPPDQGYGERDYTLIQSIPRDRFEGIGDLEVGIRLEMQDQTGTHIATVTEIDDSTVTLDGNHPLAGLTLNFDVNVVGVREATAEEIDHGHVHSAGCHDDDCNCGCDGDDCNTGCCNTDQ